MKVTVTGASGFLGANISILLASKGFDVYCVKRKHSNISHLSSYPFTWVEGDITVPGSLDKAFSGSDYVFHCAGLTGSSNKLTDSLISINISGTQEVLKACQREKVQRLIHCSSVAAIAVSEDGTPVNELAPHWNLRKFGLDDGYSLSKHLAQEHVLTAVKSGLIDAVIISPTIMFGAHDSKPSSGKLIIDLLSGKIPAIPTGQQNFVNVTDVAQGMLLAAEKGLCGENYILGGEQKSFPELATMIYKLAGLEKKPKKLAKLLAIIIGKVGDLIEVVSGKNTLLNSSGVRMAFFEGGIFSSDKAITQLGYTPKPITTGIIEAISWFRSNGRL